MKCVEYPHYLIDRLSLTLDIRTEIMIRRELIPKDIKLNTRHWILVTLCLIVETRELIKKCVHLEKKTNDAMGIAHRVFHNLDVTESELTASIQELQDFISQYPNVVDRLKHISASEKPRTQLLQILSSHKEAFEHFQLITTEKIIKLLYTYPVDEDQFNKLIIGLNYYLVYCTRKMLDLGVSKEENDQLIRHLVTWVIKDEVVSKEHLVATFQYVEIKLNLIRGIRSKLNKLSLTSYEVKTTVNCLRYEINNLEDLLLITKTMKLLNDRLSKVY